MAQYKIERFEMPNLRALNFYIHDVLGEGVSSNHRIDGQAKSLGAVSYTHLTLPTKA